MQRIGQSLRQGSPNGVKLERFEEALHDSSAHLTYPALSGTRKQSIEDVERLFGEKLIKWMKDKGYKEEMMFLRVVRDWRNACDMRGLTNAERSQYCSNFLKYLLNELMPWHETHDYSFMEVNQ